MWILDLLAGFFGAGVPGATLSFERDLSPSQSLTNAVGTILLPVLGFVLVAFLGIWRHPGVSLLILPGALVAATAALSATLDRDSTWTLRVTLLTAIACWVSCGAAFLLGVFLGFFHEF